MTDAPLKLSLIADLPNERLARLTRDLERDLTRAGVRARPIEAPAALGERGEPITLGVLALALITSGTVKAVIECFKAYFSREHKLSLKLTRADGTQVEVTALNIDTPAVREALEAPDAARLG
jgi:Effector Associated Constant Component 1